MTEGGKTNTRNSKFTHHIFLAANSSETVLTASKMAYLNNSNHFGVLNGKVEQIRSWIAV